MYLELWWFRCHSFPLYDLPSNVRVVRVSGFVGIVCACHDLTEKRVCSNCWENPLSLEDLLGNASKHLLISRCTPLNTFFWTLKLWWWKEEKAGTQRSTMGIFNVHASFRRCSFDQGGVNSSNVTSTDRRGIPPKWPYFSESSLVKCLHSLRFTCQALDLWVLLPTSTTYITDSYGSNL